MFCGDFVGWECFQNKVSVYEKVAGEVRRPPATFENPGCARRHYQKKEMQNLGQTENITCTKNKEKNTKTIAKTVLSATKFMKF